MSERAESPQVTAHAPSQEPARSQARRIAVSTTAGSATGCGFPRTGREGVKAGEELALEPHEFSLSLLGFVLDVEKRAWSAHFYARLNDMTGEQLQTLE
ncbi:hypothetical protein [Streptomyces sp. C]|uniref:hypothetical protein n=1 Tax=Streptomyces sp. C TaxID=253839 RepID=UPI0001B537BE|nr:hypothetical protein [Streptomyces sp. C]EFL19529.1 predicted protein [Streptomyces sp. C]